MPMPRNFGKGKSFVSGEIETDRIKIFYFRRDSDGALCAKLRIGYGAEGPINHAHGGSMAAILDEGMGFACWIAGHPVVAASITINFLRSLPLEKLVHLEAWVEDVADNKVSTLGRILDPETGQRYAEGSGLFIKRPIEFFGNLGDVAEMRGIG
jgi:acyl-coenzyme A thioesterase PaaI-like protein